MEDKKRLASLDLLRGTDIFILTVAAFIVRGIDRICPLPKGLMAQLDHPAWVGFTAYDMIMPLFIFMCGAALPLALPKRLEPDGHAGWRYWRHVLGRVALLWTLGMVAQGELTSFDLHRISFFNNTLQTIACGYMIAAAVMLVKHWWARVAVAFALAVGYTVFLHTCGDMTPGGNAAVVYEVKFLSLFYPDATWHPVKQIADWHYTWWTTIPMFGFMALAGAYATEVLKGSFSAEKVKGRGEGEQRNVLTIEQYRKAGTLAAVGVGLLALGWAFSAFDPVVKHIFTASFTFLAMGTAYLLYALFYWVFDIVGIRRGTGLIALFGRHSLVAYMLVETTCRSILWTMAAVVLCGTDRKTGHGLSRFFERPTFDLVMTAAISILLCVILYCWDEWKKVKSKSEK